MTFENQDYINKVVSFSTVESTLAILSPSLEMQLEKKFIVGTIAKSSTTNDWAVGKTCAISWESVTDYIIFDSVEEYIELMSKS